MGMRNVPRVRGGIVVPFPKPGRHGRASASAAGRQSSAVTNPSVSTLMADAKDAESQDFRLRMRLIVDRSQDTPRARMRAAMSSSSKPRSDMKSASCMGRNVHQVHNLVNIPCAPPGVQNPVGDVHPVHMGKKTKPLWRPSKLRKWRIHAEKSLEEVAPQMGMKHHQLSRIERGLQKWDQRVLETAALEYGCSVCDLLERDPPAKAAPAEKSEPPPLRMVRRK